MQKRLLYRREDRKVLRRMAIWIECMMLFTGTVLLGILVFA